MTFSQSFIDKYSDNSEMQSIIEIVDKHLEGSKMEDIDREAIYEFVYGFTQFRHGYIVWKVK